MGFEIQFLINERPTNQRGFADYLVLKIPCNCHNFSSAVKLS